MILGLSIGPEYYLALSALLFTIGAGGLLIRRNPLVMFMCIELMLNAANLAFISFGKEMGDLGGQLSVLFRACSCSSRGGNRFSYCGCSNAKKAESFCR